MKTSEKNSAVDNLSSVCDSFSSVVKTIHLFDQFIDSGILKIPSEEVEEVRNNVKVPLTMMLSCLQENIEELQNELKEKCNTYIK